MFNKKTLTALLSLALAGSMAVPACAAEALPARPGTGETAVLLDRDNSMLISPSALLTRAELLSALYQEAGSPETDTWTDFRDVDPSAPYADAVCWACASGIASGYGNGCFGPDDLVTREQTAVIFYRLAQEKGLGFTGCWAFPLDYSDAEEISDFALEAVCWMTMKDIMAGTDDNRFAPGRAVTQEEAQDILQRYSQAAGQAERANPFLTCGTMEEAAGVAGFSLDLSRTPLRDQVSAIRAAESGVIEVVCTGEQGRLTIRKGTGTEDLSGDYTPYPQVRTEMLEGSSVTMKGSGGKIMVATWSSGDYTYSVRTDEGLEPDALLELAAGIR